jgi:hypothetical protein
VKQMGYSSQFILLLILEQIERQPNGKIPFTTRGRDPEGIQQVRKMVKVRNCQVTFSKNERKITHKIDPKVELESILWKEKSSNLGKIPFITKGNENGKGDLISEGIFTLIKILNY